MQWWLVRSPNVMSVDNDSVQDLDLTALASTIWMLQWRDGHGEIERESTNGLRENFFDIIPYCPFFQQFLTKMPNLTLVQAKKVQTDLIAEIYRSKRQAPFAYTVAAGALTWEANDETVTAMSLTAVPALYNMVSDSGASSLVGLINNRLAALATNVNGNFTSLISYIGARIVDKGNALITFLNQRVIGDGSGDASYQTINRQLQYNEAHGGAAPGITSGMLTVSVTFDAIPALPSVAVTPITPGSAVPSGNAIPWMPLGATSTVNLTMAEMIGLMSGIATRRKTLQTTRNSKTAAVNALTTIAAVIAYDVTAGW